MLCSLSEKESIAIIARSAFEGYQLLYYPGDSPLPFVIVSNIISAHAALLEKTIFLSAHHEAHGLALKYVHIISHRELMSKISHLLTPVRRKKICKGRFDQRLYSLFSMLCQVLSDPGQCQLALTPSEHRQRHREMLDIVFQVMMSQQPPYSECELATLGEQAITSEQEYIRVSAAGRRENTRDIN